MFFNYLKLSFRLLLRNPFFTFINVAGLSVGFAVFFILWQHAQSELKSDQYHKDWERIGRFGLISKWTDDKVHWEQVTQSFINVEFARQVAAEHSQIEAMTSLSFYLSKGTIVSYENPHGEQKSFFEPKMLYADSNFFDFFSVPLIYGSEKNILSLAGSVILSEKTAIKYFGNENPVGKILLLNNETALNVQGVFKNLPENTHLDFDVLISSEGIKNPTAQCYFKLRKGTDAKIFFKKINTELKTLIQKVAFDNRPYRDGEVYFQPLSEMPFVSYSGDQYKTESRFLLTIFQYASVIILVLAWINYINLTISSNQTRMKEIGARKTVGARPADFIFQFTIEATLINLISLMLAGTLIQLLKYPAEFFVDFKIPEWSSIPFSVFLIVGIAIVVGIIITGLYPTIVTLKRSPKSLFGHLTLRPNGGGNYILTTFQFSVAVILFVWFFTVYTQINFILHKDIGLSKEHVLVIDLPEKKSENFDAELSAFVHFLSSRSGVEEFSVSQSVPGNGSQYWSLLTRKENDNTAGIECNGGVDEHFIPFYKINLIAGRNFLPDHPGNKGTVIISIAAARRLGFDNPKEILGQKIFINELDFPRTPNLSVEVIGVIEDYKLRPLLNEGYVSYGGNPGLVMTYKNYTGPDASRSKPAAISLRITPGQFQQTISEIQRRYAKNFHGQLFNWYFLDKIINGKYQKHEIARNQIVLFTVIAIGIACLGLLGMIVNRIVEKTKEIGIRKVLGAPMHQIAHVLLNTTIKQLMIATIIGVPIAYYLTQQYLEKFSERIHLQWWHFALPVLILLIIMFLTVASVLLRAARRNPIESLRYE